MKERWRLSRAKTLKINDVIWDTHSCREAYVLKVQTATKLTRNGTSPVVLFDAVRTDNILFSVTFDAERYVLVKAALASPPPPSPALPTPPPTHYIRDFGELRTHISWWTRFKVLVHGR